MFLIGLLTGTEKQVHLEVHLGGLHMRPIQWHLVNNWRVPESLEKAIPTDPRVAGASSPFPGTAPQRGLTDALDYIIL